MQDLRLIERRDETLILESIDGTEYTLDVTDEIVAAVHVITRAQQSKANEVKVSPRKVQTLLREGHSVEAITAELGIESDDVERYAGPIHAEFQFILSQALNVPVRAEAANQEDPQFFGAVIEARLAKLGAESHAWRTWRDAEEGWMVQLAFTSHGVEHDAQWAFEHRKHLLSPVTPDAVNLSKQGDVGDKLIPTLRAVDRPEETSSFNAASFEPVAEDPAEAADVTEPEPLEPLSSQSDFERRQGIEQRAIITDPEPRDLGETSDLLDALRKRRSERDSADEPDTKTHDIVAPGSDLNEATERPQINIWAPPAAPADDRSTEPATPEAAPELVEPEPQQAEEKSPKKGRQSIPSWDEILFGTRSDDE